MNLENAGSMNFWIRHDNPDWSTNEHRYNFAPIVYQNITVHPIKQPDQTVEVRIEGPFGKTFLFQEPIPPCDKRGLMISLQWNQDPEQVKLSFGGTLVRTLSLAEAVCG